MAAALEADGRIKLERHQNIPCFRDQAVVYLKSTVQAILNSDSRIGIRAKKEVEAGLGPDTLTQELLVLAGVLNVTPKMAAPDSEFALSIQDLRATGKLFGMKRSIAPEKCADTNVHSLLMLPRAGGSLLAAGRLDRWLLCQMLLSLLLC